MIIDKYIPKLPTDVTVTFVTGLGHEDYQLLAYDADHVVLRQEYEVSIVPWSSIAALNMGVETLPDI